MLTFEKKKKKKAWQNLTNLQVKIKMFGGKLDTFPPLYASVFLYGPGSQLTLLPQCTLLRRGKDVR